MVSVATGHTEFYPFYASLSNVHKSVQCAHWNAVSLLGFLAMPKSMCPQFSYFSYIWVRLTWIIYPIASWEFSDSATFQKFHCQLFHTSLEHILSALWPFMTKPHITKCGDGHWRHVIYRLGPYIVDYLEQALLSWVCVQSMFFSIFILSVLSHGIRCTANCDNLDVTSGQRSHEHTDTLLEALTLC